MDRRAIYGSGMLVGHLRKDYEIEEWSGQLADLRKKGENRAVPIFLQENVV